jgi:uncharacterized membrane protein YsdA (DUF1294 family)
MVIVLVLLNLGTFFLYGYDKACAKRGGRRIPQKVLLGAAALFSGPGALLGMFSFRHKTRKPLFLICVPLFVVIQAVLIFKLYPQI